MNTEKEYVAYKTVRYPGQLREIVGDDKESYCSHISCNKCNGTGWIDQDRCPNAIACNCAKCLGLRH